MPTLGIRTTPKIVYFAIYDEINDNVLNVEEVRIPAALTVPLSLKYIRSTVLDILRQYQVHAACIRVTEPTGEINISRVQIEGVIQEAFASSDLQKYCTANIATIARLIKIKKENFKPAVNEGVNELNIANWENHKKEEREAILCAIGAINA